MELEQLELEKQRVRIELKQMDIEQQKVQIELKRLDDERSRAWWTSISILIPLLIAAVGFAINAWSQARQAQDDFELKEVEIIMDTSSPTGTRNRARALATLFPNRLPENYAESFDPDLFGGPSSDSKKELIRLIVENPDQEQKILQVWKLLFPGDEWVDPLLTQTL